MEKEEKAAETGEIRTLEATDDKWKSPNLPGSTNS